MNKENRPSLEHRQQATVLDHAAKIQRFRPSNRSQDSAHTFNLYKRSRVTNKENNIYIANYNKTNNNIESK